jgi:hypothetical protein
MKCFVRTRKKEQGQIPTACRYLEEKNQRKLYYLPMISYFSFEFYIDIPF